MAFPSNGSLITAKKISGSEATEIETTATIPVDTSIDVFVRQDHTGDGTPDEQVALSIDDGTNTYSLDQFIASDGAEYWLEINLSTSDSQIAPTFNSAEVLSGSGVILTETVGTNTGHPTGRFFQLLDEIVSSNTERNIEWNLTGSLHWDLNIDWFNAIETEHIDIDGSIFSLVNSETDGHLITSRMFDTANATRLQTIATIPNDTSIDVTVNQIFSEKLAMGGEDDNAYVYNVSDWSTDNTFTNAGDNVTSVSFSPDGSLLAYGTSNNDVYIRDMSDGSLIQTLENGNSGIQTVSFSPDGSLIAYGSNDSNVYVHNTSDWSLEQTLTNGGDEVLSLDFSTDSNFIAYGQDDTLGSTVYVFDTTGWSLQQSLTQANDSVESVAFSSNYIAYGSDGGGVYIHNISDWSLQENLTESPDIITSITFSPDENLIAYSAGGLSPDNEGVYIHNVSDWSLTQVLNESGEGIETVSFSHDGQLIAYGSDTSMYIHNTSDWGLEQTITEMAGAQNVRSVEFQPTILSQQTAIDDGENTYTLDQFISSDSQYFLQIDLAAVGTVETESVSRGADSSTIQTTNGNGVVIETHEEITETTITLSSNTSGVTDAYLLDENNMQLENVNFSFGGDTATFTTTLDENTLYVIEVDADGGEYDCGLDSDPSFPYTGNHVDIVNGYADGSSTITNTYNIITVETTANSGPPENIPVFDAATVMTGAIELLFEVIGERTSKPVNIFKQLSYISSVTPEQVNRAQIGITLSEVETYVDDVQIGIHTTLSESMGTISEYTQMFSKSLRTRINWRKGQ